MLQFISPGYLLPRHGQIWQFVRLNVWLFVKKFAHLSSIPQRNKTKLVSNTKSVCKTYSHPHGQDAPRRNILRSVVAS